LKQLPLSLQTLPFPQRRPAGQSLVSAQSTRLSQSSSIPLSQISRWGVRAVQPTQEPELQCSVPLPQALEHERVRPSSIWLLQSLSLPSQTSMEGSQLMQVRVASSHRTAQPVSSQFDPSARQVRSVLPLHILLRGTQTPRQAPLEQTNGQFDPLTQ
jgi:hypothetical protein